MNKKKTNANTKGRAALHRVLVTVSLIVMLAIGVSAVLSPDPVFAGGPSVDVCGAAGKCNSFVDKYINPVIVFLTVVVGIAAVISIIMAGIQYSSSADDPGTVSKAKSRIFNTVIGLVAYIFFLAFFNYLVPGGFF